jgi:preprotein translocase subunit SecF
VINFLKYKYIYFILSGLVIVSGLLSLISFGLRPAIDFIGGTVWEVRFNQKITNSDISKYFGDKKNTDFGSAVSTPNSLILKFKPLTDEQQTALTSELEAKFGKFETVRFETVGPLLGRELIVKTVVAVVLAALLIMTYIIYQFHDRLFGLSAIAAMLHDTLVILGVFSLLGHFLGIEVDTLYVTAVLTILSFSTHDTVVVYDRIRELLAAFPSKPFSEVVNLALNETAVRSLNKSLTIVFMLLALVLLGGGSIRIFAIALLVGTISGAYSSMFTASPILVVWYEFLSRRQKLAAAKR